MRSVLALVLCLAAFASCRHVFAADLATLPAYTFAEESASGEVDVRAVIVTPDPLPAKSVARIVFSYLDADNCLAVDFAEGAVTVGKVDGGQASVILGPAQCPEIAAPGKHSVVIKRRDWSIRVLVDNRMVATVREAYSPGERVGYVAKGLQVKDILCQDIGDLTFADDFSRPAGEPDPWTPVRGTWQTVLPDARNKASDAVHSANPFSYRATGDSALALLSSDHYPGASYWSEYEVSASVKLADGVAGIAFACRDADNYYLLRATSAAAADAKGTVELVKVLGGQETVLGSAAAPVGTGKWYRLSARLCEGELEGLLDGGLLCSASDSDLTQGRIGLLTKACSKANFDDIAVRSWKSAREDFGPNSESCFETVGGFWRVRGGWLVGTATRGARFTSCMLGGVRWRDYSVKAQVSAQTAKAVGVYLACAGPENYLLFRWGPDPVSGGEDAQQLWKVAGGKSALLATQSAPLPRKDAFRVKVTNDRGYLAVAVDGATVLEAADVMPGGGPATQCSGGRIGFLAEGATGQQAAFGDLRVSFCDPPPAPVEVAQQFAAEDLMAAWARPGRSWNALGNGLNAYALPVWGDFLVRVALPPLPAGATEWTMGLRVAATAEALATAADAVTITGHAGAASLACAAGATTGQATCANEEPVLELERRGSSLIARLDGQPFGAARIADGAAAPVVGLNLAGAPPSLDKVRLTSPNILDDAFSNAPVNWAPSAGTWDISDRWMCSPVWGFYCGREAPTPMTWHKRPISGDMVAEFWAGMMMDGGPGNYQHPSDLNGIICGDGKSKDVGYIFAFASDNNTATKLLRNGQVVASTPDFHFINANSGNMEFHRHWFHCRLEKIGGTLTYFVDEKKVLAWTDPAPLDGGSFGIHTEQGNGIMIARARVAFQR